ncbi:MAG: CBS domain-containing protein [Sedimentisphaerales bacterium]|nr:CBS domain-containing protein [Sedimentisphaerales bacterium]
MSNTKQRDHLMDIYTGQLPSDRLITSSRTWLTVAEVMSKDVTTFPPDDTVVSAANTMSRKKISCLVITDHGTVVGILTETDMLKRVVNQGADHYQLMINQVMSSPVESVPSTVSIIDASRKMNEKRIRRLPVLQEDRLVGIITQTDMVRALTSYGMFRDVSEILSRDVACIQSGAKVKEAVAIMASQGISCIVVMDKYDIVGILTEKDILGQVISLQRDPGSIKIEEIMSSPVTVIPPSYSVFSASRKMEEMNIRRLVVMKDKHLYGIITQTDIFSAVGNKLQAEEEKNFKLLQASTNNIFTTDINYVITYVNPAFMKLLEVSNPQELVGQPFLPERFWFKPEERKEFLTELEGKSIESRELILKTSKGKKIYVTVFHAFTKNIHGEINGSQGIVYDITEKKQLVALRQTEEKLQESQRKYSQLVQESPDAIISLDTMGHFLSFNPAAEQFSGFSEQEVIGKHFTKLGILAKESIRRSLKEFGLVLAGVERPPFDVVVTRKDQSRLSMEANGRLIKHKGQKTLIQVVLRDVTERKRAEAELERLNKDLELAVRQLSRANQELEEFVYIAAHDLKTPLRGIGILADWLSIDYFDQFDDAGKEHIKLLADKTKNMNTLIDDILRYSKLTRKISEKQEVNLNAIVSEIIADIHPPENIQITLENNLPTFMCEKTHMVQIFQNLLVNAVKYIDKPEGRIRINCEKQDEFWQFSIADNGSGIEQKHFDRIFRMFQMLASREGTESNGIGLSIVKKITEMNGGKTWVESDLGKGSTFFFTLPRSMDINNIKHQAVAAL